MAFPDSTCTTFPTQAIPGGIPFASIAYVTAANAAGDHLVVGALQGGVGGVNAILGNIPLPSVPNQTFCDAQVQLAPQQFYPNVYVPTQLERMGNFSAFAGLLVNPANGQPYSGGMIPGGQLGAVYAWRIGAAQPISAIRGWSLTGSMSAGRATHSAVLLPSGKVLVVSGNSGETYDPTTGAFTPTSKLLFQHAGFSTATLLNDSRVLIVGGTVALSFGELYDPASGNFVATGGTVAEHGNGLTATLLADGRVLIAGGFDASQGLSVAAAEIYDPTTGSFTKTGSLATDRFGHTATLLQDGRVLVAGGDHVVDATFNPLSSAEIFDPATGQFSTTGAMHAGRDSPFAVRLASGKVLIGELDSFTELFDPANGTFELTGRMSAPRQYGTATLLSSGQALVAGGLVAVARTVAPTNSAELYNPVTGTFSPTGSTVSARSYHTATALLDGRVLVTGGIGRFPPQQPLASAELYTPLMEGLVTSQTGLTFRAAQGAGALPPQNVAILSNTDTIPFTVSTSTYTGGKWLQASPSSATSTPGAAPVKLSISADATGLAAQDYYGAVTLTPTDGTHPPISISVVLSIVPAGAATPPAVSPSGLVFLTSPGSAVKAQSFSISNLTSKAVSFTGAASATPNWFDFSPKSANIGAGQSATITVTPAITNLTAGVYRGSIKLSFNDNSTQTVDLLLVISPTAGTLTTPEEAPRATSCTPSKLLPVFTSIGTGFNTPAAWPTAIAVVVVDDCGALVNSDSVTVSFSNGDPPLALLPIGNANWTGTWVPVHSSTSTFAARADARQASLSGSAQVTGQVADNPNVPSVAASDIFSSGDLTSPPAQGLLVTILGKALADGDAVAAGPPLPQQLGSTSVIVSGTQLPLLDVSENQIDAQIPYDLAANAPHQLIVLRGNAISVPVTIAVYDSQPAILSTAGNGAGQGQIYTVDDAGNQVLADANSPATAGDLLVINAVGLGAVDPPVNAGDPAPDNPPSTVTALVSLTIGGQSATVLSAVLTPGSAGLYQVQAMVPDGISPGDQVPVVLAVAGKSSVGNTYMGIQ
ncbi:MAG TPA: kelch repeat-containing protein [Bryobacteraceae bacterium]|nr:kelch repeat-containing protein [Bryobacteraceae bacterium]